MIFEQEILDALERLEPQGWVGEVWRVVVGQRNPFLPNRRGARWNPPETAALYTSLERETVLAELDHLRNLQTPPVKRSIYRLHKLGVRVERMLDLRDTQLLESLGVARPDLAGTDHAPCQRVGGAAAWLGCDSILVPSVRGSADNLVVFVDRQEPDALLAQIESEELND